ncbi:LysR substrate-binding domain-containing protein [Pseudomonas sp. RIT-PI-S]|uniref:LysR substrate-binding domain-containing protein n=1 Tax=Pseudomonas sp. RIT-PI-S TaxID=3035295 RepID=UPI0021D977AB|nr:LysR substrate-binding domain-containing protein [Pseudomonas sp. RIT-PI-S]
MDVAGELEIFTLVADTLSFSETGRVLRLAPSSIARTIDRLEARIGVRLLLRTTRALALTAEGATYVSSARRILADLKETEQLIAHQSSPRGRLRVSASVLYGKTFLLPLLKEFIQRYPDILIEINLTDVVVDISAGQADVALRLGPLADGPLKARRLGRTRKLIVASPCYLARRGTPQVPQDLLDHDCIDFNFKRAAPGWPFLDGGQEYALKIKGCVETNNGDTQGQLAREGIGIARVCAETVQQAIVAGELVPILEAFNPGDGEEIHVVFLGGSHLPARVRCFVDYLVECFSVGGENIGCIAKGGAV